MEGIFIKLLNLSIQASILITVVLLLRFILNKSPKSIKCLLWALVAIRLVCPFSIESKFSLAPDAEVVSMDNYVGMPNVLSKTTGSDRYVKGYAESYDHEVVTVEKKTRILSIFFQSFGWVALLSWRYTLWEAA
ncbi:MAG: M56 family metallopeptidase [Waltera sp.]